MKVTLARALKEKKRLAGRINIIEQFVSKNNIYEKENKDFPSYKVETKKDITEKMKSLLKLRINMILVKSAIAKANAENGICDLVYEMEECKSEISFYRRIMTNTSMKSFDVNNTVIFIESAAQITENDVELKMEELSRKIENLQDKIDNINATVTIDIPLYDE